jgi:Mn-dependent DtxR family transcriptional regulator
MSKGTIHRTVRIEDGLWEEAKAAASERGENLSDVIRQALWEYVNNHTKEV